MKHNRRFVFGYGPRLGAVLVLCLAAVALAQEGPNLRFEAAQAQTSHSYAAGAVGLDYLVSVWQPDDSDSLALDVFSRSGVLLQRAPLSSLFEDSSAFGPTVLFDTHRQRFVLAAHGYRNSIAGVSTVALAVSRTANPLDGWHSFAITHPGHLTGVKLGFNRHWYAISAYDAYAPLEPGRPHLYVFESGAAANGAVKVTAFDLTRELGVLEYFDPFAAPAITYDKSDRLYIAGTHTNDTGSGSTGLLRMARIEGTAADPVFVTAPLFPAGPAWTRAASAFPNTVPSAAQPQGVTAADTIEGADGAWNDSISTAIYRNGYLWCAQMIGVGSGAAARSGVQLWQISPLTGTTIRTGRLSDSTSPTAAWFAPALAVNNANEMFFTVNRSSTTEAVSSYYVLIDGSDSLLRRLNAGSGSLSGPLGALWPPANAAATDPADGRAFWGYARHLSGANVPAYWWAKVNPVPVALGFRSESLFVAEGTSAFAEVVLSDSLLEAVAVNFVTSDGSAVYGQDYVVRVDGQEQALGTVIISAGETRASLEVIALEDNEQEAVTESASIELFASSKGLPAGIATIDLVLGDSEERPSLFFSQTAVTLSETGGGSVGFDVAMDSAAGSPLPVSVDFAVSGGTALLNEDYVIEIDGVVDSDGTGTLSFDPNDPEDAEDAFEVSRAITARVLNDAVFEVAEDLTIQLSNPVNALLTADPQRAAATVTLLDNDLAARPSAGFQEASGVTAEGPGASGSVLVQLSGVSGVPVEVDYAFESVTASAADYTPAGGSTGTLVFAPGQTTRDLTFTVTNDALAEGPEHFRIRTTALRNAAPTGAQVHAHTITDDDSSGVFLYVDPNGPVDSKESDGTVYLPYRVSSTAHSGFQVTVSNSGTAEGGLVDYALGSNTFYVQPGATSALLPIQIVNDSTVEQNETINLFLVPSFSGVTWLPRTPPFDSLRILDDDTQREVQFSAPSQTVVEGVGVAIVTVQLSQATGQTVVMTLSGAGGTAQSGLDFRIDEPVITIPAGASEFTTQIEIFDDGQAEADEAIVLTLGKSSGNVFLGEQSVHVINIEDNDTAQGPLANFASAASQVEESNADEPVFLPITLAAPAADQVVVTVALRGGEAVENDDYTVNLDPVVFEPGEVEKPLDLTILGDRLPEGNETLILRIVSVLNGSRGSLSTHVLTIVDDEGAPTVQFAAAGSPAVEGIGAALVPVLLTAPARVQVTVDYTVESGTAGPEDFDPATGSLVFAPGQTLAFVSVAVLDDDDVEAPETVFLSLDSAAGTALGFPREHVLTLQDDDAPPTVFIGAPGAGTAQSIPESAGTLPVLISLTRPAVVQSSVAYTISGSAVSGEDFSLSDGVATFPPGATTALVSLTLLEDDIAEDPETIIITLSSPENLLIGAGTTFTYTVVDDDVPGIACTIPCALQCSSAGVAAGFEETTRAALLGVVPNPDSADLGATGIADAAHARLLDLVLADPDYVNHCCVLAAWNANLDAAGDIIDAAFPDLVPQDRDELQRLLAGIFTTQLVPGGIVVGEGADATNLDVNDYDSSAWTFLAANGDADMDGICNAGEFAAGGSIEEFLTAALDPFATTDGGGCAPCSGEGGACAENGIYSADTLPPGVPDRIITLSELLRVIQFFNSAGFGCEPASEDGYQPNDPDQNCCPHDSDYNRGQADWRIDLSELLRVIQIFNSGGYTWCPNAVPPTEDGFCPGLGGEGS